MTFRIVGALCPALVLCFLATPAQAEGLGAEAGYARANGAWGTELGAGYAIGIAGFRLTPGAGVYLRDDETAVFGRVEATFALPMTARVGLGVRISGEEPRPYATVAMPIFPKVALKGNAGPKYVSVGLTVGY